MQKILLAFVLTTSVLTAAAQPAKTKPAKAPAAKTTTAAAASPLCDALQKLAALATANKLQSLAGDHASSAYMKELFGSTLYTATTAVPGAQQSLISSDPEDGSSYHAFIKDYGTDEGEATGDFALLCNSYFGCFKGAKITKSGPREAFITIKKCRIKLRTYECSFTNSWVASLVVNYEAY